MMKKFTKLFMVAMTGLFAFSCVTDTTEDLGVNVGDKGQTTFSVSLEGSRTQLGEKDANGKYPLYWSEGDQIAINGQASAALTANYDGAATAEFQFEKELTAPYCVVYPATEGAGEGTTYPVNFLAEQPYTVGTFASGAAPLYGYVAEAGNSTIQLNHLTGVLRLAVKGNGEALTSIVIKSEIGKIAGPFTVDCTKGTLSALEGASNEVTVTFTEPLVLGAEATPIYAAVPAGSYGTFAITLHTATDKMTVKFNSTTKPIAVGSVREFTEFTYQANDEEVGGSVFEIDGKEALIEFANLVKSGTFAPSYGAAQITANVDMTGTAWEPIEGFDNFAFDGGSVSGYAIKGLTAPLFGSTSSTITNVKLTDVNIASNGRLILGAVACTLAAEGTLTNCYASGAITVSNPNATIAADADLYNTSCCGGIAGYVVGGIVDNCVNEINITVNQLASSSNTVALHPSVGGVVGRANNTGETMSSVTNCVNGAEGKTTGTIKYLDNQAESLYTAHVAGVVGFSSTTNKGTISDCTNYGAITFKANAAGTGALSYNSTSIGGIVSNTNTVFTDNNNHGSITVESGNILGLLIGGTASNATSTNVSNNHNHTNGKIWVKEPVRFYSLIVGGAIGSASYVEKTAAEKVQNLTNDGSITIEASNHSSTPLGGNMLYRIAGVLGYCNKSVVNCENKANGDITLSGNIILSRNNDQSGFNVAGVYAYSSTVGAHDNNTNRGDINLYTNVSKNSAATAEQTAYYRLDVGGVSSHTQIAPVGDESNYGNITVGKADGTAMSIVANGIYIGGVTGQRYKRGVGENHASTNSGNITINSGVTLDSSTIGIYVGGCSAYNASSTTFNNFSNSGNVTVSATVKDNIFIGGIAGEASAGVNTSSNSGNVAFNGTNSKYVYMGGLVGQLADTAMTGCTNSGDVSLNKCKSAAKAFAYVGGVLGYAPNATTLTNCNNSGVMTIPSSLNAGFEVYIGGLAGYTKDIVLDNCHNNKKAGTEWGLVIDHSCPNVTDSNRVRGGGLIGQTGKITTRNGVSNKANIHLACKYLDTGGFSVGGFVGVGGGSAHELSGTVENSGNIYYAGQCPSGTFTIGGLFGQSGSKVFAVSEDLRNTGDITLVKAYDNSFPTAKKNGIVGGIVGSHSVALSNARSFCTITAINFEDTHSSTFVNAFGMIVGSSATASLLQNCHAGGKVVTASETVDYGEDANGNHETGIVETPGALNVSNYAAWLSGDHAFSSATAKSQSCGYISAIDATPQYAN